MTSGPPAVDPEPTVDEPGPRWTIVTRGAFLYGRCLICDYQSPGRRAQYTAESDMQAHAVLCHANDLEAEQALDVEAGSPALEH